MIMAFLLRECALPSETCLYFCTTLKSGRQPEAESPTNGLQREIAVELHSVSTGRRRKLLAGITIRMDHDCPRQIIQNFTVGGRLPSTSNKEVRQ
mmetsp:Transcript_47764/g.135912  ORF Transcript_47764/g.135912 Transcript_47764/m.135912 type:complete len:95 (-) Transcript_47764:1914-2198(-)